MAGDEDVAMSRDGSRGEHRRLSRGGSQTDPAGPAADTAEDDRIEASAALRSLGQSGVMGVATADVGTHRERVRQGKMRRLALLLLPFAVWFVVRATVLHRGSFGFPHFPLGTHSVPAGLRPDRHPWLGDDRPAARGGSLAPHPLPPERDRHPLRRREGLAGRRRRGHEDPQPLPRPPDLRRADGRVPARRAILFEGPPGTGKTYLAKAMAAEAGVPFLFVSSSAFQSMFYGQTNRKIRSYFRALRKYARREGGAIGFIEEIDAIGGARGGMGTGRHHDGVAGVVNELLVQLQSFDQPPMSIRLQGALVDMVNAWLPPAPAARQAADPHRPTSSSSGPPTGPPISTRPWCDRAGSTARIYFDLPRGRAGATSSTTTSAKKAHDPELDDPATRDTLAAMTVGYSPVMLEHLLDEALVWALRRAPPALGGTTSSRPR